MLQKENSSLSLGYHKKQFLTNYNKEYVEATGVREDYRQLDCYKDKLKTLKMMYFNKKNNSSAATLLSKSMAYRTPGLTNPQSTALQPRAYKGQFISVSKNDYCLPSLFDKISPKFEYLERKKLEYKFRGSQVDQFSSMISILYTMFIPDKRDQILVEPLGAGQDVGRSCVVVKIRDKTIIFDVGLHMLHNDAQRFPDFNYFRGDKDINQCVDLVLVTHFHLDHCGALPYLTEFFGYSGPLYCTAPTKAMLPYMLEDLRKVSQDTEAFIKLHSGNKSRLVFPK